MITLLALLLVLATVAADVVRQRAARGTKGPVQVAERALVIIPTYNEAMNIGNLVPLVLAGTPGSRS